MTKLDLFKKMTLSEVATKLEVMPFYIARHYGQNGGLPADMLFDTAVLDKLRAEMGLETWWDGSPFEVDDDNPPVRLIRELTVRMLKVDVSKVERADNLYRGLKGADKDLIKAAVNELIRMGVIQSIPMAAALGVKFVPEKREILEKIAAGNKLPPSIEHLCS